ncbi:MAG: tyrosine-protein phosphatase [Planctomycetales bacterium]
MKGTRGMYQHLLTVGLLLCVGVPARGDEKPTRAASQGVVLEGQPNFRDLGGSKTADGRTVRVGTVFRSGELSRLTDQDVKKLERLGVRTVVRFLTDVEIKARGKSRLPRGAREIALPIKVGDDLAKVALEARRTGDFSKLPPEINSKAHRVLISETKTQYAALLRAVAESKNRPIVFHCSHGVHRTGTAAAILLSALGVPWETVRKDYLLSNARRKEEVAKRLRQLRELAAKHQGVAPRQVDMTNINAFYVLQPSYIDASLEEAVKRHGSMENYIRDGLGISDAEVSKLRQALLQ